MKDIKYLLKFGKKEHLEKLQNGDLFFGNAVGYRSIEENLMIKGQGDKLEASTKIFAENLKMIDNNSNHTIINNVKVKVVFRYPDADFTPIFCLFAVFEDDGVVEGSNRKIRLSKSIKDTITSHFPEADSVAIINEPKQFIEDIKKSLSKDVVADLVNYFHIDNGFPNENGVVSLDYEYFKFLTQDTPPSIEMNKKTYSFNVNYVYRILLCKDIYFADEHEFRIILPKEKIENSKIYHVDLSDKISLCDLSDIFE